MAPVAQLKDRWQYWQIPNASWHDTIAEKVSRDGFTVDEIRTDLLRRALVNDGFGSFSTEGKIDQQCTMKTNRFTVKLTYSGGDWLQGQKVPVPPKPALGDPLTVVDQNYLPWVLRDPDAERAAGSKTKEDCPPYTEMWGLTQFKDRQWGPFGNLLFGVRASKGGYWRSDQPSDMTPPVGRQAETIAGLPLLPLLTYPGRMHRMVSITLRPEVMLAWQIAGALNHDMAVYRTLVTGPASDTDGHVMSFDAPHVRFGETIGFDPTFNPNQPGIGRVVRDFILDWQEYGAIVNMSGRANMTPEDQALYGIRTSTVTGAFAGFSKADLAGREHITADKMIVWNNDPPPGVIPR